MSEGRVEDIYTRLKAMVVSFAIRPGERMNEVALARDLGVSRTPLREALNRLVAERLIGFRPGAGFFCRDLDPKAIYDLYELRNVVEIAAIRLACTRASDADIQALNTDLHATGLDVTGLTVAKAAARDESFHIGIAKLSDNGAFVTELNRLNEQIRFIRWVSMAERVGASKAEHLAIMQALLNRDADLAATVLSTHITRRMDQVVAAVKEGLSNIYMDGAQELFSRIIKEA